MVEKLKQERIPGTVPKKIAAIEDKAEELKDTTDKWMELGEKREQIQDELGTLLRKHGLKRYDLDEGYEALVETKIRAYVRRKKTAKKKDGNGK